MPHRPHVVRMADVRAEEVPWLWPGLIARKRVTLLCGRPGCTKSLCACDIAARLSVGSQWPNGGTAPVADTLMICSEDEPADTIRPRLDAAVADCERVHVLRSAIFAAASGDETEMALDLGNLAVIRQAVEALPECRLVVVDPVGSFLGARVDAHRDNSVRAVLEPLKLLAAELAFALLLVCHTRKSEAEFADDAVLGSRTFTGLARSVLHLGADRDDPGRTLLLPGKSNLAATGTGLAYRLAGGRFGPAGVGDRPGRSDRRRGVRFGGHR